MISTLMFIYSMVWCVSMLIKFINAMVVGKMLDWPPVVEVMGILTVYIPIGYQVFYWSTKLELI